MAQTRRTQRLAVLVRNELATLISQKVSDPALSSVVVNEVDLAPDLKSARVFYSLREQNRKPAEIKKGFQRAVPFLRRQLGKSLELRYVPELEFELDDHNDSVNRIMHLLDEVSHEVRAE